jgi:amidase
MITPLEYAGHDGLGLAILIRRGEVSSAEVLDVAIAQIEQHNPTVNAVIRKRYDQARSEAAEVNTDAPFAGVPFLLKDLIASIAGEPTGCGNRLLAAMPMPRDSELVCRFRAAGLVIVGRTNTPEFGLTPYTEPETFGPTRNPWSLQHSPGGSSGGSAAAVAARMVPMASGGDGGGSIRIPASCCGLFGFKPSRGMTPTGPGFGELWRGYAIEHAITRSVRDSAAMLDATAGADPGAPYAAPRPARPFLDEAGTEPGPLRIAFTGSPLLGGHGVHPDCLAALESSASLLASLGHHVEEAVPPVDREAYALAFMTVIACELRAEIENFARSTGRAIRASHFETATWGLALLGRTIKAATYVNAVRTLQLAARTMAPFFERYDVLLTPTLATPPAVIGSLQPSAGERRLLRIVNQMNAGWLLQALGVLDSVAEKIFDYVPFTALFNATGQPAMSVPLHWNGGGMPVGVQFVGKFGSDAALFRLAGQLERAQPWFERAPAGYPGRPDDA